MWTESARYILLFATAVIGLETLILLPTLWSKGSAAAIRSAYNGSLFAFGLMAVSFGILISRYVAADFSLAVVFENFSSGTSASQAFAACLSSREGLFFLFLLALTGASLLTFNTEDLSTYQERGRYLFAVCALSFLMAVLMAATADPFVRIENPPMEGLGFYAKGADSFAVLTVPATFSAYAMITAAFIKTVAMHSKGWRFAYPVLLTVLAALALLAFSSALETAFRFYAAENGTGLCNAATVLRLSVVSLSAAGILFSYLNQTSKTFGKWTVFTLLCAAVFCFADFFAREYGLFELKTDEPYFPNPVIAFYATAGVASLLLFFASSLLNKTPEESSFAPFAKETFIGLAGVAPLVAGLCGGILAFSCVLFLFRPDPPMRLNAALLEKTAFGNLAAFMIFLIIAFRRRSVTGGGVPVKPKTAVLFWSLTALAAAIAIATGAANGKTVLWTLPSLILFWSIIDALPFSGTPPPKTPAEIISKLRAVSCQSWGFLSCGAGIVLFSAALSAAVFQGTRTETVAKIANETLIAPFTVRFERLNTENTAAKTAFLMHLEHEKGLIPAVTTGSLEFGGQRENPAFKAAFFDGRTVVFAAVAQKDTDGVSVRIRKYPALICAGNGLMLFELGILLLLAAWKRRKTA